MLLNVVYPPEKSIKVPSRLVFAYLTRRTERRIVVSAPGTTHPETLSWRRIGYRWRCWHGYRKCSGATGQIRIQIRLCHHKQIDGIRRSAGIDDVQAGILNKGPVTQVTLVIRHLVRIERIVRAGRRVVAVSPILPN